MEIKEKNAIKAYQEAEHKEAKKLLCNLLPSLNHWIDLSKYNAIVVEQSNKHNGPVKFHRTSNGRIVSTLTVPMKKTRQTVRVQVKEIPLKMLEKIGFFKP